MMQSGTTEIRYRRIYKIEAHTMDLDGVTLTNTADSTTSVTADGVPGYGAKLSIEDHSNYKLRIKIS